ncbi:hypothetical protein FAIPA1_310026 [Frankia sp. AiPs1]
MESSTPDPLIDDPFGAAFLGAVDSPIPFLLRWPTEGEPVSDRHKLSLHTSRFIGVRSRFYDDVILDAVRGGAGQVVLVAAGLDTRAFRLCWPSDVTLYELDQPQVLAAGPALRRGRCSPSPVRTQSNGYARTAGPSARTTTLRSPTVTATTWLTRSPDRPPGPGSTHVSSPPSSAAPDSRSAGFHGRRCQAAVPAVGRARRTRPATPRRRTKRHARPTPASPRRRHPPRRHRPGRPPRRGRAPRTRPRLQPSRLPSRSAVTRLRRGRRKRVC